MKQSGLKGPTSWAAARDARAQRRHWDIRKYCARKLGFPRAKEFLRKLCEILARVLKTVRQSCPKVKIFYKNRFEGHQIISLPRDPTCLEPTLNERTKITERIKIKTQKRIT